MPNHRVFKFEVSKRWELLQDVPQTITATGFDVALFLRSGEIWVDSDVVIARAVELGANCGRRDAEFLLENQHLIPTEYRGGHFLVFLGTKWRVSGFGILVPCLGWNGDDDGWVPGFHWIRDGFSSESLLVRSRKPQ